MNPLAECTRLAPRRWALGASAALALSALGQSVLRLPECLAADTVPVSFDIVLAPVALDGTFPFTLQTSTGPVQAELHVNTDVKGKLHGLVEINGQGLALGGSISRHGTGSRVAITASSLGNKIRFNGEIPDGTKTLTGTSVGKGFLVKGTNPFTIDLSSAGPQTATLEFGLLISSKGKISGTGHVVSGSSEALVKASGRIATSGATITLSKGNVFRFKGTGTSSGTDMLVDWTAKGFGGSGSGTALSLVALSAPATLKYPNIPSEYEIDSPIPTIIPTTGNAPRGKIIISPRLPAGLALDPTNGRIAGTPTEIKAGTVHTVTASNYAGTNSTTLAIGTRVPRARSFATENRFLDDSDYRHFLSRAEFGVRQLGAGQTTLNRVKTIGLDAYLDSMLVFSQSGPAEAIAAPELGGGNFPSADQLSRWWTSLLMNSDNPFQERLAFFWADRFAVSSDSLEVGEARMMKDYVNLYRYEGNGNLRSLLLKMARSPAMLKYLDGRLNTAAAPNENFAREFWELFTVGIDAGYTQADIVEASRAWTGWKFVTNPSTGLVSAVFDPTLHDSGPKALLGRTMLGQSATDDYQTMVDLTVDNLQVAEFITAKLFEHFASENPHPALVADMATNLRTNSYELAPFLKAMFKSEAFFSAQARASLAKSPVEYTIGFIHLTGLKLHVTALQSNLTTLGQSPTLPPSVNGWPLGELWFSAQNMADRANFVDACLKDIARQASVGINVSAILPPVGQRSASQVVDALGALFGLTLVDAERQRCLDFLNAKGAFDGTSQAQIDDRVRGLLYILAMHPNYEVR